jgi:hemin uptake protein HemP
VLAVAAVWSVRGTDVNNPAHVELDMRTGLSSDLAGGANALEAGVEANGHPYWLRIRRIITRKWLVTWFGAPPTPDSDP